ncbi:MAG: hypothetical protein RLZZ435_1801 [Cyanobacteriota bacterium]|jgi:hypothetical protein
MVVGCAESDCCVGTQAWWIFGQNFEFFEVNFLRCPSVSMSSKMGGLRGKLFNTIGKKDQKRSQRLSEFRLGSFFGSLLTRSLV